MKSTNRIKKISCFVFLFVCMAGLVIAAEESRSSVVSTDFYIPANVSANVSGPLEDSNDHIFSWIFWGIGILIFVIVLVFGFFRMRKKKVAPIKAVKQVKKKAKKSSKRKK